ncbi:MAG TPA: four helix bundle protein [Verrucomicrobiae bacterium]|jgi:four helix bundle protein|nr:four helix bundle protein [Verrucomicrobiae bacterium]
MTTTFDHEKPEVYKKSRAFITWLEPLLQKMPKSSPIHDQLERAGVSIALTLAEGNGKFTGADRCRFFDNSGGSALECAAALEVPTAKGRCEPAEISGKERLLEIVSMLVGLIKANSDYRLHEGD